MNSLGIFVAGPVISEFTAIDVMYNSVPVHLMMWLGLALVAVCGLLYVRMNVRPK